jgi:hypothetical protein
MITRRRFVQDLALAGAAAALGPVSEALRLRETGFVKSNPDKLAAEGTDWRFLNELKKELKA